MGGSVETWHVVFSGRVQGVGFRYTCQRWAVEHDVSGWVRNLDNGQVEMTAQALPDVLRQFLQQVVETTYGHVDDVQRTRLKDPERFETFEIRRTR